MVKDQVIKLRNELGIDSGLVIYTDATRWYNDGNDCQHYIWDDANEIVYVISTNANYFTQNKDPLSLEGVQYAAIDTIMTTATKTELETLLNTLKAQGLVDDAKISHIVNSFIDNKVFNNSFPGNTVPTPKDNSGNYTKLY